MNLILQQVRKLLGLTRGEWTYYERSRLGGIDEFRILDKMYRRQKMVKIKLTEGEMRLVVFPHLIAKAIVMDDASVNELESEELIKVTCDFGIHYSSSNVELEDSDDDWGYEDEKAAEEFDEEADEDGHEEIYEEGSIFEENEDCNSSYYEEGIYGPEDVEGMLEDAMKKLEEM